MGNRTLLIDDKIVSSIKDKVENFKQNNFIKQNI